MAETDPTLPGNSIAVVGMSGRFPGARSIDELWRNLVAGVESITRFTDDELRASGVSPSLIENPDYVKARGLIDGPELFDAAFFGISHREAELMDPQQRLFLETCWLALEHAGIAPSAFSGPIGVWGGMSTGMTNNTYLLSNLHSHPGQLEAEDVLAAMLGNENDYLTTRVSYKLHLRGPSVNVQSACSTSLVAIAQAVQALLTWQCDAALAGGVSVSYPQRDGYLFQEGGIGSPDGHCRAFDKDAQGTVFSNGVGVVVLRRLEDALADRQPIYAVIRGAALNNDGSAKVSFAAPSVDGQADVIATAHAIADVLPDSIGYVEAHGTGTPLGDPIEVTALTKAFRAGGATGRQYCALGSVKSNFGHLDSAAGVTGFIKAVLALHHGKIPPTLHFREPNPRLKLPESPFYVNADARDWPRGEQPRRAGVSSFGIGGTNAHVVLEEAPTAAAAADDHAESVLLVMSGKTETAVKEAGARLAEAIAAEPGLSLADAAYTLQVGRQAMSHRRAYVCGGRDEAMALLRGQDPRRVLSGVAEQSSRSMAFLFPGGGTQYVQMGRDLLPYAPVFREEIERCLAILRPSRDLRPVLFAATEDLAEAIARLEQPSWGLPALFAVEYALARQWMAWGVKPDALIGHSMGEYTAACLAGVMSLEDALAVVLLRGRLFETLAPGEMIGVPLSEAEVLPRLGPGLAIAAVNAPGSVVVSGPPDALAAFAAAMEEDDVECRRLHIAVAAHSPMVEPILREFEQFFHGIQLHPPSIPVVSNVTGAWMTADEACSPEYWARHLRQTVRFFDGLGLLLREPNRVLLECGPGQTLSGFVRQHPEKADAQISQASLRHPKDATPDIVFLQQAVGRLWTIGVPIDWNAFTEGQERRRVALPAYAFDRKRYLIEPSHDRSPAASVGAAPPPVAMPVQHFAPVTAPSGIPSAPVAAPSVVAEAAPTQARTIVMSHQSNPLGPTTSAASVPARSRADRIRDRLSELLQKLSGLAAGDIDPNVSFLEMGFDSLFLTQASLRFKNEFKVRIGFRQLFEDAPTLSALAAYIDGKLPADVFPAPAAPAPVAAAPVAAAPAAPVAAPAAMTPQAAPVAPAYAAAPPAVPQYYAPVPQAPVAMPQFQPQYQPVAIAPQQAGAAAQIIQYQLQLMTEQLRLLGGAPAMPVMPMAAPAWPAQVVAEVPVAMPAPPQVVAQPVEYSPTAPAAVEPAAQDEPAPKGPVNIPSFGPFRGIDRSNKEVTDHQQRYLDALIDRYTTRTKGSKDLTASQRARLADPRQVSGFRKLWKEMVYQIATARSSGSRMWDIDGNEYIDLTSGFGVNIFGYASPFILDAVHKQLDAGFEIGTLSPLAKEAADLICDMTGHERVSFANTGSEAISGAIRGLRTATGKDWIAVFDDEYHGIAEEVLVKAVGGKGHTRSAPAAPGIPDHFVDKVIVLHYDDPRSLDIIRERADEIAAVIIEPVQNRHPDFRPAEMIRKIREVTRECDIALMFDEMITGFRLDKRGALGYFDVDADVCCYGKIMSGGLPIAAIAGKAQYLDAFDGGPWQFGDDSFPEGGVTFFGGTFTRNVLSLSASVAALREIKALPDSKWHELNAKSDRFADAVNAIFRKYHAPIRLEHCGSVCNIIFTDENPLPKLLTYYLREKGVHTWDRPFFISMVHTEEELAFIVKAFEDTLAEMHEAQFLGNVTDGPSGPAGSGGGGHRALESSVIPFTEAQLEVYIGSQMSAASLRSFNEVVALDMRGPVDLAAMQRALGQVVARHESLRMTVSREPLGFTLAEALDVPVSFEDVSMLPAAERDERARELMRDGDSEPFDLATGPLLRLTLLKVGDSQHLMVLVAHHLVCDGLSFGIVLRDLAVCYSALVTGRRPELPESVSAVAFAEEARSADQVEARAEAEEYWLSQFKNLPDPLDLPADRPRADTRTYHGERVAVMLPLEINRAVKQLAASQRATVFATMLTGFAALVARLSGQRDFVVGIPVAGQSFLENQELVAHCVNFVPLRCQIDPSASFASQLEAIRKQSLGINEYNNFTYGSLLNKLRLPRNPSRDPLVTVSFTVEPAIEDLGFHGIDAALRTVPRTTAKRDMHVNVMETATGLLVEADVNRDMYETATVRRWLESFGELLQAAVAQPAARIDQLSMVSARDRDQLLRQWNATTREYPADRLLHEMVEAHAARTPQSLALVDGARRLTWQQLNARANQIAHALVRRGVTRGSVVGLGLERSADFIASMLAAHKAGAAYLPLDTTYPVERLNFLREDARVSVTVVHAAAADRFSGAGQVLTLGGAADEASREPADNLPRRVAEPADLAYIIYTSGSTGTPKGVGVEHRQLLNYTHAISERLALPANASYALVSTVAADLGMTSIFPPLANGGVLHVIAQDLITDGRSLAAYMAAERVDAMKITPSHLAALLQQHPSADLMPAQRLVLGGELARASWVAELRRLAPHCQIFNHYGPTETTVGGLAFTVTDEPTLATGDWLPIGRPLGNVRVYVLDAGGALAPVGIPGELFIGGAGVARGYLHRDQLTAERFVKDPFASLPDARMYRTGDRVRWLANGTIEFLGRVDHQVKIRGFRVELGEVESTLRSQGSIDQAVVLLHEDKAGDQTLVAYVTGRAVDTAAVRTHARRTLPDYAVPGVIAVLDALPLTPNGKVDRKALAARPVHEETAATASVPAAPVSVTPSTPTEVKLAAIWRDVLKVKQVALTDDFFLQGGHSLMAMRLVGRLYNDFGVTLLPGALFQYSVFGELARHIDTLAPPAPAPASETAPASAPASTALLPAPTISLVPAAAAAALPRGSNVVQMPPLRRRLEQKVLVQLASGGKGVPFFWVHGVGGEVFSYVQLSRHLAEKRPVYGFTADWSQLGGDQLPTLEEMAALYVSEMRKVQPSGPYFMGGFCSASMLALEMARQIEADGERVGLLAAIDYDLVPVETSPSGLSALFAFLRNVPRWIREDAMASGMKELKGRVRSRLRNAMSALKKSRASAMAVKEVDFRDAHGMWRFPDYQVAMLRAHHQAINSYQPKSLNGRVALFIPRTMPLLGPWPTGHGAQWDDIARGGVEVHQVRGSHTTMLKEPFVEALGKRLNSCIDEAEPRPEGRPPHSVLKSTTAGAAVALSMPIP